MKGRERETVKDFHFPIGAVGERGNEDWKRGKGYDALCMYTSTPIVSFHFSCLLSGSRIHLIPFQHFPHFSPSGFAVR